MQSATDDPYCHWATCVVLHPLSLRGLHFFFAETSTLFRFVLPVVPSSAAQCSPVTTTVSSAHRAGATARSPWSPGRTASTAGVISFNILPLSVSHLTDIRYQSCLAAGMRPSWILSEEERARRFKTLFSIRFLETTFQVARKNDREGLPSSPTCSSDLSCRAGRGCSLGGDRSSLPQRLRSSRRGDHRRPSAERLSPRPRCGHRPTYRGVLSSASRLFQPL